MSETGAMAEAIAERWLARALATFPPGTRATRGANPDQFRDPAGHLLNHNLRILAGELLGEMSRDRLMAPLDAIVRLRAVQAFSPSQALQFIFTLRDAAAEVPGASTAQLQERIDALALMAFDLYMACREQIYALRTREIRFQAQCAARPE